jgi:hypothetical protein
MEVGPLIQQLVGWMIKVLTGTSRHEADPFRSICWMPCEMGPEGNNPIAVTKPIRARRRVSDLAEFVGKRTNPAGMAPGPRCAEWTGASWAGKANAVSSLELALWQAVLLRGRPEDQVSVADSLRNHRLTRQLPLHVLKHAIDIFLEGALDEECI